MTDYATTASPTPASIPNPFRIEVIARTFIGAVLLLAAGLKGYELATGPVAEKDLLTSRWFLIGVVEFEGALGLALVSGLWPRWIWRSALFTFAIFTSISSYKAWRGDTNCGCFGRVGIDPKYALALDLILLATLLIFRPRHSEIESRARMWPGVAMALCVLGIPSGIAMAMPRAAVLTAEEGELLSNNSFVVLEPEKWVGKTFPLFKYIDVNERLRQGKWLVVLYSHDCSHCIAALPHYKQAAAVFSSQDNGPRIALIELPPFEETPEPLSAPTPWISGRLSPNREWFAQTPVEIELNDGKVMRAQSQAEGTAFRSTQLIP